MPPRPRSTSTAKQPCPECGSRRHVPIAYGYPGPELFEKARTGCVILGGCLVDEGNPRFECKDCGTRF